MNEIWLNINGYEKMYQISNLGRVRSLDRTLPNTRHKGFFKIIKGRVLKAWDNGNGYLVVTFSVKGNHKNKYVHRLVAEHFISNIKNDLVINHIDFNRSNNDVSNLEIVTQKENTNHSARNNRMSRGKIKRSDGVVYESMTQAARMNNVVITSIESAITRKHRCKGFNFVKLY